MALYSEKVMDKKEKVVTKDANGKKEIRNRHGVTKAEKGHFDKAGVSAKRYVREFKFENAADYNLADEIKADIFAEGDKIDATAISKGKPNGLLRRMVSAISSVLAQFVCFLEIP